MAVMLMTICKLGGCRSEGTEEGNGAGRRGPHRVGGHAEPLQDLGKGSEQNAGTVAGVVGITKERVGQGGTGQELEGDIHVACVSPVHKSRSLAEWGGGALRPGRQGGCVRWLGHLPSESVLDMNGPRAWALIPLLWKVCGREG